jgi:DNA phosphorothioation-dependent restriction protein DptG
MLLIKGKDVLIALTIKYNNDWMQIYHAIKNKEKLSDEELNKTKMIKGKTVTIIDDDYPEELKITYKPPFVIFFNKKDVKLLNESKDLLFNNDFFIKFLAFITLQTEMLNLEMIKRKEQKEQEQEEEEQTEEEQTEGESNDNQRHH